MVMPMVEANVVCRMVYEPCRLSFFCSAYTVRFVLFRHIFWFVFGEITPLGEIIVNFLSLISPINI